MIMRPLDLPEDDLLQLFAKAMVEGVFSDDFLRACRARSTAISGTGRSDAHRT